MLEIKEQDRKKDQEGQAAIKRLSKPIKVRILLAQIFTILSALLSFVPYLALVWLGDIFLSAQTTGEQISAVQVHKVVNLLVMAFLSKLFFHALSLIITHFADMKLRFIIRQRIVERLSHVPLAWFSQTDSGKIRNAVQDDTKTVHTVVAHAPVDMLPAVSGLVLPAAPEHGVVLHPPLTAGGAVPLGAEKEGEVHLHRPGIDGDGGDL